MSLAVARSLKWVLDDTLKNVVSCKQRLGFKFRVLVNKHSSRFRGETAASFLHAQSWKKITCRDLLRVHLFIFSLLMRCHQKIAWRTFPQRLSKAINNICRFSSNLLAFNPNFVWRTIGKRTTEINCWWQSFLSLLINRTRGSIIWGEVQLNEFTSHRWESTKKAWLPLIVSPLFRFKFSTAEIKKEIKAALEQRWACCVFDVFSFEVNFCSNF